MIQKIQRQKIIDKIIKLKPFYFLSMRKGRFLYAPIKTIIFYFLVLFNQYSPIKIKIRARTIFGDKIAGYSSSSIGPIYYLGFQDPRLTVFLIRNLKPDDVFIDAGSNIGYYSLLAKNLVGPKGKIYSFEPTPAVCLVLRENTKNFSNIFINQTALSNKIGFVNFFDYGSRFSSFNTLFQREVGFLKSVEKTIKIKTETLDSFCIKRNIIPTTIKLDTEGSEYLVLEGASVIISRYHPLVILEVGGEKEWKGNCQKSLNFLSDHNYKIFELKYNFLF